MEYTDMDAKIMDILYQEKLLTSREIALKIGLKRAKDVQNKLKELLNAEIVDKNKENRQVFWSLSKKFIND